MHTPRRWLAGVVALSLVGEIGPRVAAASPAIGETDRGDEDAEVGGADEAGEAHEASEAGEATAPPPAGDEDTQERSAASEAPAADAPVGAPDDRLAEATRWWLKGQALADDGLYFEAAEAWLRSYEAHPTEDALINAARAFQLADHPLPALRTFERYVAAHGAEGRFAREAAAALPRLVAKVGTIDAQRTAEDRRPAALTINDELHALADLPLHVEPGRVVVVLIAEDGRRIPLDIHYVEAGATLVLDLAVPDASSSSKVEAAPLAIPDYARNRALRSSVYSGVALTAVAAGALGLFAGLTRAARRDYLANNCGGACTEGEVDPDQAERMREAERRALHFRTTTNVLVVVTAAFGVTTAVLAALSWTGTRRPLRPRLKARMGGLQLVF